MRDNFPGLLLTIAGVALVLAAAVTNRPGNFNIRPEPKPTGRLIIGGGLSQS